MGESEEQRDDDPTDRAKWYEWFDPSPSDQAIPVGPPVDSGEVQRELRDPHPFTPRVGEERPKSSDSADRIWQAGRDRLDWLPDRERPYDGFGPDWKSDPHQILRAIVRVSFWTFIPHSKNAATRKILTLFLMITWSTLTIGQAFGIAEVGEVYYVVTVIVFTIVSQIWGIELGAISAIATADSPDQAEGMRGNLPDDKYDYDHRPGRIPAQRPYRTDHHDYYRPGGDPAQRGPTPGPGYPPMIEPEQPPDDRDPDENEPDHEEQKDEQ